MKKNYSDFKSSGFIEYKSISETSLFLFTGWLGNVIKDKFWLVLNCF